MNAKLTFAPALALAACADTSTIHHSYYNSAYAPSHVMLASASSPALAVIRNNPFPQDRNNEGVLAAMQGRNFGPRIYFSQTPRADDKYGYKVILNFGSDSPGSSYSSLSGASYQCQAEATPPSSTQRHGEIAVSATFCVDDRLLTDASGSISEATGPEDPRFRRLIGDIMVALTPPYLPDRGRDCNMFNC